MKGTKPASPVFSITGKLDDVSHKGEGSRGKKEGRGGCPREEGDMRLDEANDAAQNLSETNRKKGRAESHGEKGLLSLRKTKTVPHAITAKKFSCWEGPGNPLREVARPRWDAFPRGKRRARKKKKSKEGLGKKGDGTSVPLFTARL